MTDYSAAAERNTAPIIAALEDVLPRSGLVLEIASGTGQHVVAFARRFPALVFQPTDRDPAAIEEISKRCALASLPNVRLPALLDVEEEWRIDRADAIVCINMVHISPWSATLALFRNTAAILPPSGVLFLYGPYWRDDVQSAPSNIRFDADLRSRNPDWGIRDLSDVRALASEQGFEPPEVGECPANNITLTFTRA